MLSKLQGEDRIVRLYDFEKNDAEDILYVVMEKGDTDLATLLKVSNYYWFTFFKKKNLNTWKIWGFQMKVLAIDLINVCAFHQIMYKLLINLSELRNFSYRKI